MSKIKAMVICISGMLIYASGVLGDGKQLSGDELKTLFPNSTMTGTSPRNGRTFYVKFSSDGTFTLEVPEANFSDNGTWEIKGDKYCSERTKRESECFTFYDEGDGVYLRRDDRGQGLKVKIAK